MHNHYYYYYSHRDGIGKAQLVSHSCDMEDLIYVLINLSFENDLSQLAIENATVLTTTTLHATVWDA